MSEPAEKSAEGGGCPEVGVRLREARAKAGLTRKQLSRLSGVSERYLAHIEAGDGNPSLSFLGALADALDMAVADLLPMGGERSEAQAHVAAIIRRFPAERLADLQAWIDLRPTMADGKGRRVVLVGLRGAGKSSLGKALASALDMPFFEISKEVEQAYGGEMRLLVEMNGQAVLRRYEAEAWDSICARHEAAVIAAPGGIVADSVLYERVLATAHSIWLRANPEDHMARVVAQGDLRPMSRNPSAMADLQAILAARSADYARADLQVDTSAQTFDDTLHILRQQVAQILRR